MDTSFDFQYFLNTLYVVGKTNPVALKTYYRLVKLKPHLDLGGVHWVAEDLIDELRDHGVATNNPDLVDLAGQLAGHLGEL